MSYADYPIHKLTLSDNAYTRSLKQIKNPPKQLYYRGNLDCLRNKSIAIVGSRKMTRYGKEVTGQFVADFVSAKITTISGFMYGVDTIVHQKTVEFAGNTVAVFGCGLDYIYPSENEKLYEQILDNNGLVLSEYEPSAKAHLWKYPQRNRIVAGLASLGVLVVEAGMKSGSLITASLALEMNKSLYAVPGPINSSTSAGTNMLIKTGQAKLVTNSSDILGKLKKKKARITAEPSPDLNKTEQQIWDKLNSEPCSIDELSAALGISVVELSQIITQMSLKGVIAESAGKYYLNSV